MQHDYETKLSMLVRELAILTRRFTFSYVPLFKDVDYEKKNQFSHRKV